ncbi:MAG: winged helix-turn-helix transcriptional regulator [Firmicutes bacterium]|nr:winged helix-turn-helix transcriptional regulator [Bacillota bacterium]
MTDIQKSIVREIDTLTLLKKISVAKMCNDVGLYYGQPPIIEYILYHDGCTQKNIAEFFNVTPASIALSTKRLQKAGYIEKKTDEHNLRCNSLHVTEHGKEVSKKWREELDLYTQSIFSGFTQDELETFCSFLRRMNENTSGGKKINSDKEFFDLLNEAKMTKNNNNAEVENG